MKRIITICAALLMTTSVFAQAPNKMSYQAVIRNISNALVTNQSVGMQISILQGSPSGSSVYVETQVPTTNLNGLASIEIGGGTIVSGNFSSINWLNGPYFIKTETDPTGGTNYIISGTSQLLSVPYALFSGNGVQRISATGDSLLLGNGTSIIVPGISGANNIGGQTGLTQHTCGATNVHNPAKAYGSLTDQEGNVYKTIVIGAQEWMAENLRTNNYRNGDQIDNLTDGNQWFGASAGAWAYIYNLSQYECPYGKLYNGYAVVDPRHLCPTGWHVPTDVEWTILTDYLGGELIAAGKMKTTGLQYWNTPNFGATNESGFSGIASGLRFSEGGPFTGIGVNGLWWSSSVDDFGQILFRSMDSSSLGVSRSAIPKNRGLSVRCLKD